MNCWGVDGCRAGWFYIKLNDRNRYQYGVLGTIDELSRLVEPEDRVLIDIPIGLNEAGSAERKCDKEARKLLTPKRGSSVFPVPCRPALYADDYAGASEINYQLTGRKLSQQSWGIASKIREVDELIIACGDDLNLREMHPEVCFWALNNQSPMDYPKKTPEGISERLALLAVHFDSAKTLFDQALTDFPRKHVARDDILDAMVGLVTAMGRLRSIPSSPQVDDRGLAMEMVYADL